MSSSAESISRLLAALGTSGSFATRFSVQADPQLHVDGVGSIALPLTIQTAHQLCAVAQPAHHGYKDQTRLDPRVRDTWEIPGSRLRFDSPQWRSVLDRALERVRRDLGLPSGARLDAELHNLLVYAPGQFFAVHQDSEKTDGMLGTLVVTLPSRFSGGEFVVSHQGQALRARGSASRLDMVAFYADCHHEVRPVKQGYRVVLTYNLICLGGAQAADVPAADVAKLADAVSAFWRTPPPPRWTGDTATEPPDRVVYLLDHQYTQSGLSWKQLKGADPARVAALRKVAEQLDAEIFLALADVHESWSAEPDYEESRRWDYEDDEEDDEDVHDGDAGEPTLGELIESDIELRHWLAVDGSKLASDASCVADAELCFTRATSDCEPFESEYEGYMGNYGNTVDRWYHRAAVVMWPRERAFVIRARQSPGWAIEQIAANLEARDPAQALELAQRLHPFWNRAAAAADGAALFAATLPVASELKDEQTAADLLAPFSLRQLTPEAASWLVRLLERYGIAWCEARLHQWVARYQTDEDQLSWLAQVLPELTRLWGAAVAVDGPALAAFLVQERWNWLRKHVNDVQAGLGGSAATRALADTGPAWLGLIRGSRDARSHNLQQRIIDALLSAELPVEVPLRVLRAVRADTPDVSGLGLTSVHVYCIQVLGARLAQPERAADDWSILPPTDCVGELGEPLSQFLRAATKRQLEWPLAEAKRRVIHQLIDRHELPVRHETRRSGRPYTLVLEKTGALFERDAAERRQWKKDLAWLRKTGGSFTRARE